MSSPFLPEEVGALMRQSQWREAIALCAAVPMSELEPEVLWDFAWAHFKIGDYSTARTLFEAALALRPDHAVTLWGLGVVLQRLGVLDGAKRSLRRALELKDSTMVRLDLAIVFMKERDFGAAEQVHLDGLALRPTSAERVEGYGDFLADVGRPDEAEVQYKRARKLRV
jgi:Flp pilus assembly protein TadD